MTLKELKSKVSVKQTSDGYIVTIYYRKKKYSCFSNNSLAYARINTSEVNKVGEKVEMYFYTLKNAYLSFYDECKVKNGFKIYIYGNKTL